MASMSEKNAELALEFINTLKDAEGIDIYQEEMFGACLLLLSEKRTLFAASRFTQQYISMIPDERFILMQQDLCCLIDILFDIMDMHFAELAVICSCLVTIDLILYMATNNQVDEIISRCQLQRFVLDKLSVHECENISKTSTNIISSYLSEDN